MVSADEPLSASRTPPRPDTGTAGQGRQLSDDAFAEKSRQTALENSLSGKSVAWKNPASGARGSVTPLKTWKNKKGTYCRSYSEWIRQASGKSIRRQGVACRTANAIWKAA